jgi:ABC-type lipopolysaccharide export system ATPase subunit
MNLDLLESVVNRSHFLQGVYEEKLTQKSKIELEVNSLREEKDILDKTEKVIKYLMDKLVKNDLSSMDALISYVLKTVYTDRDLQFKSEIIEYGKKIWIDLQTISDGKKVDPQSQSSVHVIESFLLRLLCVIKLKKAKLLLLDETFAAVDPGYIENFSQLIVQLCTKLGMDILLVTHNMGFIDFANHSYRISRTDNKTDVEKLK